MRELIALNLSGSNKNYKPKNIFFVFNVLVACFIQKDLELTEIKQNNNLLVLFFRFVIQGVGCVLILLANEMELHWVFMVVMVKAVIR